jgi:Ca2+-binding EF-hand superfamily protein
MQCAYYQPGFQPRDPAAFAWFCAVDTNRSGTVDEHELQRALSSGGWTAFCRKTTRKLIKMFDHDHSNSLGYGEFEQLVAYLRTWQAQFQHASQGTGRLSHAHMPAVLPQLGYNFPPPLAMAIFQACALWLYWGGGQGGAASVAVLGMT